MRPLYFAMALILAPACSTSDGSEDARPGGSGAGGSPASGGSASGSGGFPSSGSSGQGGSAGTAGPVGGAGANGGSSSAGSPGAGGDSGAVGGGGSGSGGAGSAGAGPSSDLPVPPGPTVAKPSGAVGGLSVLAWAGFRGAVSYSFDDSLSSQTAHYAELQATGVRMTFYIVSNNAGSGSTWIQAAADGHEIGNHTAHHCHDNGSGCAWGNYAGSLAGEFEQCTTYITQQLGVPGVWTSASPYGDGGFGAAAAAAFLLNRGVQGGQIAPDDNTDPYRLPCHLAAEGETQSGFNAATDSARSNGRWQIFLIHSLGGDGGYNPISTSELVASVNHAKSLGDVWIDSVINVGAYWRAQKVLSAVTPQTSGGETTWSWTLPAHFPPGKFLRVTVTGGTLRQGDTVLAWHDRGYYEVALDAGSLTLSP
jgi:peptidoglycan/xylan/chitin deacetylase (PgdA/CDA1 family)